MSPETPIEGESGEPAPSAQPAPPPSDPAAFVSPAPAAWSAPAGWTAPTPPPWPAPDDAAASPPAGNGFGPARSDPWAAQSPADSPAGQPAVPSAAQYSYPPTGQYGHPPYYSPAPARTNRLAIAALVCGVAQFFLGLFALNFLLATPAIICGAIGMRQTRLRGEGGRGLSIAGLVLGILGIVWNVLYVVLIVALGAHFSPGGPSSSTP